MLHEEATKFSSLDSDANDDDDSDLDTDTDTDDSLDSPHDSGDELEDGKIIRKRSSSRERAQNILKIDNSSKTNNTTELSPYSSSSSNASLVDEDDTYFFHIAFTPIECTVICSTSVMEKLFTKPLLVCADLNYTDVKLINQTFLTLQIDSDGSFNNNLRILELTKPLSENNISLFFLSSHFSDIVLIPYHLKKKVINILTKHNFQFSDISNSYIVTNNVNNLEDDDQIPPFDPSNNQVEINTFNLFKSSKIKPKIRKQVKLLLTGARSGETINTILKTAKIISSNSIPDYFAITRTSINEVSLILPKSSRKRESMGFTSNNIIGSDQDVIVPITIDLYKLPLDSKGIVAGLASKIINGIQKIPELVGSPFEMNYLSMARSAIVMIPRENLADVSKILKEIDYDHLDIHDSEAADDQLTLEVSSLKV